MSPQVDSHMVADSCELRQTHRHYCLERVEEAVVVPLYHRMQGPANPLEGVVEAV